MREDYVLPPVPVRQWVLSFPIPLRILSAAHPELLSPVLQIVHRVIATFLIKQSGLNRSAADTGAVTRIQRFGSAANLNTLQAASCTDHMALGPRAGQKVLSLHTVPATDKSSTPGLCTNRHGFSLYAGVRWGAHQRQELERLCRTITRPAIANERLKRNGAGVAATEECLPGRHHA